MDSDISPDDTPLDAPDPPGDDVLHTLITDEMGETVAELMRQSRRGKEAWQRRQNPDEGRRERKVRLTRQLISDAATTLFVTRGFDNVKVADVAERVDVSLKTIYNYFPTKESMVLDGADESVETLAAALRERLPGESITEAAVRSLKADMDRYDQVPEALVQFLPKFMGMIEGTPALRAAWLELHDRLAQVARDEIAIAAGIDPRDPEPTAAGRALASLPEVTIQSRVRHTESGLRGKPLREAIINDLDRAARLLETGLCSFNAPLCADQMQAATRAAEETRVQVLKALNEARATWGPAPAVEDALGAAREAKETARKTTEAARRAKEAARRARRAGRGDSRAKPSKGS